MNIADPSQLIYKVKSKIKNEWKIAFITTFILGLLFHLYIMLNNFPNHDGLYSIYSTQNNIYNGRWFLMSACSISSFFNLPWVIGILSIIYLSITSIIVVELFEIKNKLNIILTSAILISFPTIASGFCYIFMMDGFMLSLLLSALSVLLIYKHKYGFVFGSIFLCLSIGIYQAYLSFALILCIIKILISILNQKNNKELLIELLKNVCMIFLGFIFYYFLLKILLKLQNTSLSSYQGVDSLTSFASLNIIKGIYITYRSFIGFMLHNSFLRNNIVIAFCNITILVLIVYLYLYNYIKNKLYKNLFINCLTTLILIAIPIATSIIKLISTNTYYHLLMQYHWCLIYITLIILIEKYCNNNYIKWISFVSLVCIVFNYYIITNIAYFNVEYKFEKSKSLGLRIVDRIEQFDEYTPNMHIAIIGTLSNDYYPSTDITENITNNITGSSGNIILFDPYHYESLFKNYFNYTITYATEEEIYTIVHSDEFLQMGFWPQKDALKIINNVLVVKLSNIEI